MSKKKKSLKAIDSFEKKVNQLSHISSNDSWEGFQNRKHTIYHIISSCFNINFYTLKFSINAISPKKINKIVDFLDILELEDVQRYYIMNKCYILSAIEYSSILKKEIQQTSKKSILFFDTNTNKYAFIFNKDLTLVNSEMASEFPIINNDIERSIKFYQENLEKDFPEQSWSLFTRNNTYNNTFSNYPFFMY